MFVKSDLSQIPANAAIIKAELHLKAIPLEKTPFWYKADTAYSRTSKLFLYEITKEWCEDSLVNTPQVWGEYSEAFNTTPIDSIIYTSEVSSMQFDVTEHVNSVYKKEKSHYGYLIKSDYRYNYADGTGGSMTYWGSSEAVDDAQRPKLIVHYETGGEKVKELLTSAGQFFKFDGTILCYKGENAELRLLNMQGKLLYEQTLEYNEKSDLSHKVIQGVYVVELITHSGLVQRSKIKVIPSK